MRTSKLADSLFPKTRQRVLAITHLHPDRSWYVRDLAQKACVRPSSLQRELLRLGNAGVLTTWRDGKRLYYQAARTCPVFPELRSLTAKTTGLVEVVRDALKPLKGRIRMAFIFGSIAEGVEGTSSDIDLMVIGTIGLRELVPVMRRLGEKLLREINPVTYAVEEFQKRAREGHFVKSVLGKPKLFVIGTEHDLEGITARGPSRKGAQPTARS